ncbi:AAEL014259-PA [Aedes aegypti]|uniref:AAEL014259-PA n=1 Tax=Aedes aegypti TaxID=7159 RepID=Q16GU9_AEDAE|nr:AAEL014259-PA [Aedes aegypti]
MAHHPIRLGSDHQRVHIVSVYHNTHLCATDVMDPEHRRVVTGKPNNLQDTSDYTHLKEWRLVPSRDGEYYGIIHHQYNEPLVAAPDDLAHDKDRRTVLTWIPGPSLGLQCLWDIKHAPEGHYLIESVQYGEYLYASDHPSKDKVFTWRKKEDPLNKQFYWDIININ